MPVQVGSILIENNTGRILSFVGGRDFELKIITMLHRQNAQMAQQ